MRLNQLSQRIYSFWLEHYLGIKTTGSAAPTTQWGVHYTPLPYHIICRILDSLSLGKDDVFVDIGCGKGRVVCCACRRLLRRVVGIEVNPVLLKLAVANANRVRSRKTGLEALAIPAEHYDYNDATVIYLYNPFDRPIMDKVFARIDQSFQKQPRKLQVVYANCLHEEPLRQTGWLEKADEWLASEFPGFGCPISFWNSRC